jgi:Na+-transporting NADH:ubiquinone oxidoreductase subunit NqrC
MTTEDSFKELTELRKEYCAYLTDYFASLRNNGHISKGTEAAFLALISSLKSMTDKDLSWRTQMLARQIDQQESEMLQVAELLPQAALAIRALHERIEKLESASSEVNAVKNAMNNRVMPLVEQIESAMKKAEKKKELEQEKTKKEQEDMRKKVEEDKQRLKESRYFQ